MKTLKIVYWVTTVLFAGFMAITAVSNILLIPESKQFINQLGFPDHFIQFIGVAKVLGSLVLVLPMPKRLKEWAYAGLMFDLVGAVYSVARVHGFDVGMLTLIPIFAAIITSYICYHKLQDAKTLAV